jgi:hypothetical protein
LQDSQFHTLQDSQFNTKELVCSYFNDDADDDDDDDMMMTLMMTMKSGHDVSVSWAACLCVVCNLFTVFLILSPCHCRATSLRHESLYAGSSRCRCEFVFVKFQFQ